MRLATRIAAGYGLVIAVMAGMGAYQFELIRRLEATNRSLSEVSLSAVGTTLRLRGNVEQLADLTQRLFVLADPDYVEALNELRGHAEGGLDELAALRLSDAERGEVDRLAELWRGYLQAAIAEEPEALAGRGPERSPALASLNASLAGLLRQLEEILRVSQRSIAQRVEESSARVERSRWVSFGATAAGISLALVVLLVLVRSVAVPVRRLGRATHELARGDFSHRVEPAGGPELAVLAMDFNAMAARLEELDRAKRDFVSNVSHDLKAPLASIQETIRLLLDRLPGPLTPQQERLLRLTLLSAERLAGMIADLLELARLDSVSMPFRFQENDASELARAALTALEPLMRDKQLRLEAEVPADRLPIECDGPLVMRVLENLLSNAVRFSPPGGALGFAVRPTAGGGVLVEVADRGPGVPDGDKVKVFQRFHSSHPGRGPGAGTGLGLAIARSVVEGHGGAVWLRDRPGGGTVAAVVLPRRATTTVRAAGALEAAPAAGTALEIDDDEAH